MADKKITDHIQNELIALQNLAANDIRFYKEQQWKVCNYALLIYGAIIAIPKLIVSELECGEYYFLVGVCTLTLVSGIYLIHEMSIPLAKGRDRLSELRKHFDKEISLPAYAAGDDPNIALQRSYEKTSLEKFFYMVIGIGYFLTIWIIYKIMYL
jgi:hypothetical protein